MGGNIREEGKRDRLNNPCRDSLGDPTIKSRGQSFKFPTKEPKGVQTTSGLARLPESLFSPDTGKTRTTMRGGESFCDLDCAGASHQHSYWCCLRGPLLAYSNLIRINL